MTDVPANHQVLVDDSVLARARLRDQQAFEDLYRQHVGRVRRKLGLLLGQRRRADLDDLTQEVFVQVHRHLVAFRGDANFTTWLYRITVNVALMHLRGRGRFSAFLERLGQALRPAPATPEERLLGAQRGAQALRLLDCLPHEQRAVFVLYEVEGHTLGEIAALTDAPLNTVASRLRAARQRVQDLLRPAPARAGGAP